MVEFDVAVVGLGVMGAASAYELAARGSRVVAFDRFTPPHTYGSTHGRTRIIREAYFEDPLYVPLVQRAYEKWAELEERTRQQLFIRTGGLMIGPEAGAIFAGSLQSAIDHDLPHEVLSAEETRRRFPGLHPEAGMLALLEPRAGLLLPELCLQGFLDLASAHGAVLQSESSVAGWSSRPDGIEVRLGTGERVRCGQLVLAAGPWATDLLDGAEIPLQPERQTFHWFEPATTEFAADVCPIALWEYDAGRYFATFSDIGHGLKAGIHHEGQNTHPDRVDRQANADDESAIRALLERFLPAANHRLLDTAVCLYTNTPDHDFVLDRHPHDDRVIVVSPCSGHGFKFASAIGEVVADLATAGGSRFDLHAFRIDRFHDVEV